STYTAITVIYTLSLHDALPIYFLAASQEMDRFLKMTSAPTLEDLCYALDLNRRAPLIKQRQNRPQQLATLIANHLKIDSQATDIDRKSTRLNSSHVKISYAVFC